MDIVPPLPEDCEKDIPYKPHTGHGLKDKLRRLREKYGDQSKAILKEVEALLEGCSISMETSPSHRDVLALNDIHYDVN